MSQTSPHITPPKAATRLLLRFIKDELAEEVLGDLEEKFLKTIQTKTAKQARKNYWYQVIQYIRPFALKKTQITRSTGTKSIRHVQTLSQNLMEKPGSQ